MSDDLENIEVSTEDDDIEVELPEKEEPVAQEKPAAEPEEGADEEDLSAYSARVQKRISKLTREREEERRLRQQEAAEKARLQQERDEALRLAEQMRSANSRLQDELITGTGVAIKQVKDRIDAQLIQAKLKYRTAYEAGDPDALSDASELIAKLTAEKARVEAIPPRQKQPEFEPTERPQAQPAVDAKAQAWVQRNSWFNEDPTMRGYALGVHEQLVKEGIAGGSDLYYSRIDDAVKSRFPEKFGAAPEAKPTRTANVVAPASRTTGTSPRKVTLTSSEVLIAKRLGLTPEQYARQKLKDMSNG